eukprot:2622620-Heterocapsa_arctica.AAC.1
MARFRAEYERLAREKDEMVEETAQLERDCERQMMELGDTAMLVKAAIMKEDGERRMLYNEISML